MIGTLFTCPDKEFVADKIQDVDYYVLTLAAVADRLCEFSRINMLCNIGNGTINVMFIN